MLNRLKTCIISFDGKVNSMYTKCFGGNAGLLIILFHGLFENEAERRKNHIDGSLGVTVDQFDSFARYFIDNGYMAVGPDEIKAGLGEKGKHFMFTFDDGYFNNIKAIPVMEKYDIPAVFFVSTGNVIMNRSYWGDVLFRECIDRGYNEDDIRRIRLSLKRMTDAVIEKRLKEMFGKNCFEPKSDIDRPMSVSELANFSKNNLVHIGNHTMDHAILTNYQLENACSQLVDSQKELENIIGYLPDSIAYPNGNYNKEIIYLSNKLGFKLGFTTYDIKNKFPIGNMLELHRIKAVPNKNILEQCDRACSDLRIYSRVKRMYKRTKIGVL